MSDRSTMPSRDEVAMLARQAGLSLEEPYFSELLDSYEHVHAMLVRQRKAVNELLPARAGKAEG